MTGPLYIKELNKVNEDKKYNVCLFTLKYSEVPS